MKNDQNDHKNDQKMSYCSSSRVETLCRLVSPRIARTFCWKTFLESVNMSCDAFESTTVLYLFMFLPHFFTLFT